MAYELTVSIGSNAKTAILQDGFYILNAPSQNLHTHNYTEFHTITGGTARFLIGKSIYTMQSGDVFAVPPNIPHTCLSCDPGLRHTAFQIDSPVPCFSRHSIPPALAETFMQEISIRQGCADHTTLSVYIALLCAAFYPDCRVLTQVSADHAYIISEFFSRRYREDVTLEDLAKELHFSQKHTARLVLKHTGSTFTQALAAHRMSIARHLSETTDLSLAQIAQYVGYQSYSGFWKAYKKSIGRDSS